MDVIWNRPERNARGPKPAHTRDEVAEAGVRVADAEGIDAVSMRRVATELGVGVASLYRYLTSKDDLLDLMVDAAMRAQDPPPRSGEWRADLRALAEAGRALMLRHPWLPPVAAARPNLGPGSLRWMEAWYQAIDGHGLSADEMLVSVTTVQLFVQGAVTSEVAARGLDFDAWLAAQGDYGDSIIRDGAYPATIRVMVEARGPHESGRGEKAFTRGLEQLLDGIAATMG
ncbi:TetR/AcrR family transcriptional regulator [Nonomuraea sp. NPDC050556]|uniref:TetR/AcrR family transcriptional regulator n=1 Tax=Nonomuraea sp. NPDC050556 TaxID=3364369 RepID=UPI0037964543